MESRARRHHEGTHAAGLTVGSRPACSPRLSTPPVGNPQGKGFQMYKPDDLKNWAKTQKGAAKGKAEGGDDGEL